MRRALAVKGAGVKVCDEILELSCGT
jgi:hypothetical protein